MTMECPFHQTADGAGWWRSPPLPFTLLVSVARAKGKPRHECESDCDKKDFSWIIIPWPTKRGFRDKRLIDQVAGIDRT